MNELLNYMLEASFGLAFFYGVYHLLLRNETNFHFNRLFLLASLAFSIVLPLLTFNLFTTGSSTGLPTMGDAIPTYWLPEYQAVSTSSGQPVLLATMWKLLLVLHTIGITLLLLRLFFQIKAIVQHVSNSTITKIESVYVLEIPHDSPTFSFFNYIFIGQSNLLNDVEKRSILEHELVHVKRCHTFDVLFVNLLCALFWFHPIVYLYKKSLVQLHEFEADSRAANNLGVNAYCGLLAKVTLQAVDFPIVNYFNNSLTLKRIHMIKALKRNISVWKKVVLIPLVAFCFIIIACEDQIVNDIQSIANNPTITSNAPSQALKAIDLSPKIDIAGKPVVKPSIPVEKNKKSIEVPIEEVIINNIAPASTSNPKGQESNQQKNSVDQPGNLPENNSEITNIDEQVFTIVEETATPLNGLRSFYENIIATNLTYPQQARTDEVEGKVFVQFIINKDGTLSDITVIKGIGSGCDEEAIRVMKLSPPWNPGKQNGIAVKQRMVLPINFTIN